MRISKTIISKLILASVGFLTIGCDNENGGTVNSTKYNYFVGIEAATDPATDVLVAGKSLKEGVISPVNSGFQQSASTSFYTVNNKIITNAYKSPPQFTSYELVDGKLKKGSSFITDLGIYAHTSDGSNLILMGSPRAGFAKKKIFIADTETMSITTQKEVDFGNIEADNIMSFPIDMILRDNKLFIAYYEILADGKFSTPKSNQAKVAIFNYPSLKFDKIITDTRVPNLGRYYSFNTLEEDENGNIYTFASSSLACGFAPTPATNSGILRIKKGETTFDPDFHIDFETLSNGYKINDLFYVANGKAVVRILKEDEKNSKYLWGSYSPTNETPILETGIIDLNNKKFTLLSDVPKCGGGWASASLVENGKLYLGVNAKDYADIYEIDVEAKTAKKGAKIEGNYAKAILKLTE